MRKDSSVIAPCAVMVILLPTNQLSSTTNSVQYSLRNPEGQCQTKGPVPSKLNKNCWTASDPSSIPPMVLKKLSNEVAHLLEMIFRRSLATGHVQEDWKELT